ncbi:Glycogen synthase [Palleronia abyssalis]|uniref:Glycogen synthase n=2 Tax=Palleronia abyssalis TaxID=1501240 RepID=A0A2R8BXI3_9RHOB|nr:Glycogen synthase [Palleronia abyssalis]
MGGIEAHSWHLCRGLAARGHEVTLLAAGDSDAGVPLYSVVERHYDSHMPWHSYRETPELTAYLDRAYGDALDVLGSGRFDVVHNNGLHRFPPRFARRDRMPMVTTLHVPPFDVLKRAVDDGVAPWHAYTVTSQRQMHSWWGDAPPDAARVVSNGIDMGDWPYQPQGNGEAVWVGRITRTKAPHLAVEAARIAGRQLTLFGSIEDRDYFEEDLRPLLGQGVRYGGHLEQTELAAEIGRGSVFVFTPLWDEPFGLVAVEAMACGLPVAGIDRGAVAEVVGGAGCLSRSEAPEDLAAAIDDAARVPRPIPRSRVERRFTMDRMLDGYEAAYCDVIAAQGAEWSDPDFERFKLPPRSVAAE